MSDESMSPLYRRRLQVQLRRAVITGGLDVSVSSVRCGMTGCSGLAWRPGTRYCRACWLRVMGQDHASDERG